MAKSTSCLIRPALLWWSVTVLPAGAGAAGIVATAQERTISANLVEANLLWLPSSNPFFPDFDGHDSELLTTHGPVVAEASDFELFDETATATDQSPDVEASSTASQRSLISQDEVSATGSAAVSLTAHNEAGRFGPFNYRVQSTRAQPHASFSCTFELESESGYRLAARIERIPTDVPEQAQLFPFFAAGAARVSLVGPDDQVITDESIPEFDCSGFCSIDEKQVDLDGTLPPGTYTLSALASMEAITTCLDLDDGVTCFVEEGMSQFDVTLRIAAPEPQAIGLRLAALMVLAVWRRTAGAGRTDV